MPKILGVDYGEAKIGLALSDERGKIAFPYKTIATGKNPYEAIDKAIQGYHVDKIVVGLPLHMNGKESPLSLKVREFAATLQKKLQIPVTLFDERLTSAFSEKEMLEMEMNRKKRSEKSDVTAAVIILQNYLDSCIARD